MCLKTGTKSRARASDKNLALITCTVDTYAFIRSSANCFSLSALVITDGFTDTVEKAAKYGSVQLLVSVPMSLTCMFNSCLIPDASPHQRSRFVQMVLCANGS